MNMVNKCAKFHKDSPSDKQKLNQISRAPLNFRRRPFLCTTLYRNPMQVSNFGGTFDQLFLWIFLWNFHRRCLSTSYIPWCKNSQRWPKIQIKGGDPAGRTPSILHTSYFIIVLAVKSFTTLSRGSMFLFWAISRPWFAERLRARAKLVKICNNTGVQPMRAPTVNFTSFFLDEKGSRSIVSSHFCLILSREIMVPGPSSFF